MHISLIFDLYYLMCNLSVVDLVIKQIQILLFPYYLWNCPQYTLRIAHRTKILNLEKQLFFF